MMTFFPVPYEDELLYSILGRYHIRSGNISIKATLQDVFSKNSVTAVVDLPSHINRIIDNMPVGNQYTADYLVDKHTLYSFYSAFLPPENALKIKQYMKGDKGGSIYNKIGLMASSVSLNQYFKFCPQCIKEDMGKYGELYWHRVHQIPGVLVCPKHKIPLYDSQVPVRGFKRHEYITASSDNCKISNEKTNYPDEILQKMIILARDIDFLLNNIFVNKTLEWFRGQYLNRLKELGFANINGRIKQKDLLKNFVDYYGHQFLKLLQSDIDIYSNCNWLTDILRRKNKTSHPLRHLLLIRFLNISIEDLFNLKLEYKPFGFGPWPCLNPAVEHYKALTIQDMQIKYGNDSKNPLGIFTCSCGFSYMRTGPDTQDKDKYKITKIIAFGPVWEAKLKELVEMRLSLRETARLLKVDPTTVKKYARNLRLKTYYQGKNQIKEKVKDNIKSMENENDKLNICRQRWLDLMKQYPNKGKTELRRINGALFSWLYRNDRDWLNENSPELRSTTNINSRVDWEQRDEEILEKVKAAVDEMLATDTKPQRITISSAGSKAGIRPLLEKHLDKLPKTKAYLEGYTESIKDFQIRRIKWAIQELQNEGQELKLWRIYRLAGIRQENEAALKAEVLKLINGLDLKKHPPGDL